ncbi:Ltp family lipoprotein [bacterium]|nr:Ltp family lipoprotein [bacterium]
MKLRNKYQNFVRNKYGEKYNLFIINFAYASIKFLLSFFIIFVFALMSPSNSSTADKSSQTDISVNNEKKQIVIPDNSNIQSQKQSGKTKVPVEYKNALIKAESYSKVMHMSKKGIYEQLTSEYGEQFSEDAAKYAVDNLKADYNLNALEKAKNYQKTMHMSKQGIYEQLISEYGENFTEQEAKYAVNHLED